jgi:hypothetical protein
MGFSSPHDLELVILVPTESRSGFDHVAFSIRRLARELGDFLAWFNQYGTACLGAA